MDGKDRFQRILPRARQQVRTDNVAPRTRGNRNRFIAQCGNRLRCDQAGRNNETIAIIIAEHPIKILGHCCLPFGCNYSVQYRTYLA